MNPFAGRLSDKNAFSFIEIFLVISLLGIVIGLSFPNFRQMYDHFQLQHTTQNLADMMRYTQGRAIIKRRVHQLVLDPVSRQYWLTAKESHSPPSREASLQGNLQDIPAQAQGARIKGRLGKTFHLPDKIRLISEVPVISFYPDGRIDPVLMYLCGARHCLM